jgi:hypothetical protein
VTFDYLHGTDREVAWFKEAVQRCTYPFERITTHVTVEWRAEVPIGHTYAGQATPYTPNDACGRPNKATIILRHDLDDPNQSGKPKGFYAGKRFYQETCIHELGHVVEFKFSDAQIARMSALFDGGSPADWADDGLNHDDRRRESFAETFKDVYLPLPFRRFNNRTRHKLLQSHFEEFMQVLDGVCPCAAVTFPTSHGGDPGPDT